MVENNSQNGGPAWRKALLPVGGTIQDAISNLNYSSLQIVIIVNERGQLVGTVTDGDIRRGLLRGCGLADDAAAVMQRSPLVAPPQMGSEVARHLMKANGIQQLPIVDQDGVVVGMHVLEHLLGPIARSNAMLIMAGGAGTRLRPHTETCPKPLLAVAGKPLLEHIIERASGDGFKRFYIAVHYLGHMIEEYCGDGRQWGVEISYLKEREALGTAGALAMLTDPIEHPFVVSNGDVLSHVRYSELLDFHLRNHAVATMAVRQYEWRHPFGVVRTDGLDIVGFEEKPISRTHINAGLYVLSPDVLTVLDHDEFCDMPTLFDRLKRRGDRTIVYPMHEPWLDVGEPEQYAEAQSMVESPVIMGRF